MTTTNDKPAYETIGPGATDEQATAVAAHIAVRTGTTIVAGPFRTDHDYYGTVLSWLLADRAAHPGIVSPPVSLLFLSAPLDDETGDRLFFLSDEPETALSRPGAVSRPGAGCPSSWAAQRAAAFAAAGLTEDGRPLSAAD